MVDVGMEATTEAVNTHPSHWMAALISLVKPCRVQAPRLYLLYLPDGGLVSKSPRVRSTTILSVRRDNKLAMGGDGQVTMGEGVFKSKAKKIRRLYNDKILAGFAGSTADALSLFSRFEQKLEEYHGNLSRAVVELAKEWRTDRALRHLEALLLVADAKNTYLVSGNGDVIEPDDGIVAIGSGGPYAMAAARALMRKTPLSAEEIVKEAMQIAGEICIFTNDQVTIEEL